MFGRQAAVFRKAPGDCSLAEQDTSAYDSMAEVGDTPAAGAGDLGNEAAQMEAFHEARDLRAAPGIGGRGRAEPPGAHVAVAKAVEHVFAA
jgi:hypothetical protein